MRIRRGLVPIVCAALVGIPSGPAAGTGTGIDVTPPPAPDELVPPHLGVLLRAYEQPATPWGAGHRGVDLAVQANVTILTAALDGLLTTGVTVGNRYATIETSNASMRVTLSYLASVDVEEGSTVQAGDPIAVAGTGHPDGELPESHVHFSVRIPDLVDGSGWAYVDPMPYMRRYLRRVRGPVTRIAS